jgi:hypothetical protein
MRLPPLRAHCLNPFSSFVILLVGLIHSTVLVLPSEGQITSAENLGIILGGTKTSTPTSPTSPTGDTSQKSVFEANPGPWGRLQCAYVYLEAPKSLIEGFPLPSPTPRWTFPIAMLPQLPALFARAGLSQALIESILQPQKIVKNDTLVHVLPPLQELENLSPESRVIIYTELANTQKMSTISDPVLIIGTTVEAWYKGSKLRPNSSKKSSNSATCAARPSPSATSLHCSTTPNPTPRREPFSRLAPAPAI